MIRVFCFAVVVAIAPASLVAQQGSPADSIALDSVVAQIDGAGYEAARAQLARWQGARAASARSSDRARADVLAARLERDGVAAQHAWLGLALAHPFSPDAGLALLRVGQAAVLQGDTSTSVVYLTRLIDDFPASGLTAEAQLWLSRAHSMARRPSVACTTARAGLGTGGSSEVLGLLRLQEQRACTAVPEVVTATPAPAADGRYAVQSGAFRTRASADALIARLRQAGHEPRLVRVPSNDLMRVRVGAFRTQADATALRDRMREAGFDAVLVGDATDERPVD